MEIINPAKKAPKARERPKAEVKIAVKRHREKTAIKSNSLEPKLETQLINLGINFLPKSKTATKIAKTFKILSINKPILPLLLPMAGRITTIGKTAKSWTKSQPNIILPGRVSIPFFSDKILTTIAVEDKEKAAPINKEE